MYDHWTKVREYCLREERNMYVWRSWDTYPQVFGLGSHNTMNKEPQWALFQRGQLEPDVCEGAEWDIHPQVFGLVEAWLQWTRTNRYIRTKVISVSERTARNGCLWVCWVGYPIPILKSLVLWRPHHNEQGPIITL